MNPWPSLSKTLNASLISSSISVSWISLKNKRNFESCKFSKNCSPSHEPDKLVETYWAIPILVDLSNQLLKKQDFKVVFLLQLGKGKRYFSPAAPNQKGSNQRFASPFELRIGGEEGKFYLCKGTLRYNFKYKIFFIPTLKNSKNVRKKYCIKYFDKSTWPSSNVEMAPPPLLEHFQNWLNVDLIFRKW